MPRSPPTRGASRSPRAKPYAPCETPPHSPLPLDPLELAVNNALGLTLPLGDASTGSSTLATNSPAGPVTPETPYTWDDPLASPPVTKPASPPATKTPFPATKTSPARSSSPPASAKTSPAPSRSSSTPTSTKHKPTPKWETSTHHPDPWLTVSLRPRRNSPTFELVNLRKPRMEYYVVEKSRYAPYIGKQRIKLPTRSAQRERYLSARVVDLVARANKVSDDMAVELPAQMYSRVEGCVRCVEGKSTCFHWGKEVSPGERLGGNCLECAAAGGVCEWGEELF